nr:E3 ubiquitin-protein ligase MARCHF2-like [Dermacentor andersoni]
MLPPSTSPTETRDLRGSSAAEGSRGMDAEAPTCRICYRETVSADEELGPLVSPCCCRGLIGFAHERCLEKWLREKDTKHCDVCLQRFSVQRKPVPLWHFFRDPNHRNDVLRMVVNALSCIGDIMMLSFAWTYASGFLGSVGWLTYVFILGVLLFQTIFWMMVEFIRIMACYEPVRKWRDKTCSLDAVLKGKDSADPAPSARGLEVVVLQEKNLAPNEGGPGSGTHSPMQSRESSDLQHKLWAIQRAEKAAKGEQPMAET